MTTKTRWILGNWKQNLLREEARTCAAAIAFGVSSRMKDDETLRIGLAPSYLALDAAAPYAHPQGPLWLLGQDVAAQDAGAFTGEVGPAMLQEAGCHGAIIGHSERRARFGDTDTLVGHKLAYALRAGLTCVLCVGESLEDRDEGQHESRVISQLSQALGEVEPELWTERLVVAYEPVWAIGTGRTATPDQAAAMHRTIRGWLREQQGPRGADRSILYGGSVKPDNAGALLAAGDVDGFLVGGASLDPTAFLAIVAAASAS